MTKPKTDKGKKMDKVLNETPAQSPSESAEQAAAASGTSYGVDAEPASILLAIQNMSKTMTDRFDLLESSLASTQATLVSLGNRITEVENAAADYDRRLSLVEQKWLKIQSENISLRIFTAPLKGAYMFKFSVFSFGQSYSTTASIVKNKERIVVAHGNQPQGTLNSSKGVVLILEVGDVVYVRLWSGTRIQDNGNNHNTFSGYLLFPLSG
ncbi:hypothetical protein Q8A67_007302 [Cirrhinus molitorella]|uniref:C1q domain-containing protein n=1 Tax=Cirrhinus molitorella TaxID=172907 RepID=A0AA88U236_9TELE|nr:hypothetical protein Q8A67_007302 [Cirrhinus molitorella]